MFLDPFMPSQNAGAPGGAGAYSTIIVTPAPTTSSAVVTLPVQGECLELENTGTVTVYVEFGVGTATATVPTATPGSYGVQPGESKLIKRPVIMGAGANVIATITGSGTGALQVAAGNGN